METYYIRCPTDIHSEKRRISLNDKSRRKMSKKKAVEEERKDEEELKYRFLCTIADVINLTKIPLVRTGRKIWYNRIHCTLWATKSF